MVFSNTWTLLWILYNSWKWRSKRSRCFTLHTFDGCSRRRVLRFCLRFFRIRKKSWISGFFAKTRFSHDVFHGFTHKCSSAFKCSRLLGTTAVNSSICEQFNANIQKIKRSSKLMSQNHFNTYNFLYICGTKKTIIVSKETCCCCLWKTRTTWMKLFDFPDHKHVVLDDKRHV